MFSFLILIMFHLIPCIYHLVQDIINDNYKHCGKWITAIILLVIAVYLKSINL